MNLSQLIETAKFHVNDNPTMLSSAKLCLSDAIYHESVGEYDIAQRRAIKSLKYSLGIFSGIYQEAAKSEPINMN